MIRDRTMHVIEMHSYFSEEVKSFLTMMLEIDPEKRLGGFEDGSKDDAEQIRSHPFF